MEYQSRMRRGRQDGGFPTQRAFASPGRKTSARLAQRLKKAFALWGGPPQVLRCDNGPEFISEALRTFCEGQVGMFCEGPGGIGYVPPGQPWKNGCIESF